LVGSELLLDVDWVRHKVGADWLSCTAHVSKVNAEATISIISSILNPKSSALKSSLLIGQMSNF